MTATNTSTNASPATAAKDSDSPGLGIYRYGQGYWVRTLTAIFIGTLLFTGAGWAWRQLEALSLPKSSWNIKYETPTGTPAAGQTLKFFNDAVQPPLELGTCVVDQTTSGDVIVKHVELAVPPGEQRSYEISEATRIQSEDGGFSATITDRFGIEIFSKVYLQAGTAALILLAGASVVYWLVAVRPQTVDFLVDTDGEMKKVNWSTRKHVIDSTGVVVGATFLIAAVLWIFDVLWSRFFTLIDVLQS
ncbi:MAG: preprotein translocase subunit SecE [Phycisphaerales bacterium]